MKKELEDKLFEKYPVIFKDRTLPMTETCMCWGLSCGDGWYNLLDNLCKDLTYISKQYDVTITAEQVKEKYATLRFYYSTKYGSKWTYKKAKLAHWLYHNVGYRLYDHKMLHWLMNLIRDYYDYKTKREWSFKGKTILTEHRGNYIEHGRYMFANEGVQNLISDCINKYEDFSGLVCESCGMSGNLSKRGTWYATLCDSCRSKTEGYVKVESSKEDENV